MNFLNIRPEDALVLFSLGGITLMFISGCIGFYMATLLIVVDSTRTPIARDYLWKELRIVPKGTAFVLGAFVWFSIFLGNLTLKDQWGANAGLLIAYFFFMAFALGTLLEECKTMLDKREELIKISLLPMFVGRIAKTEVLNAMSRSLRLTLQKINGEELVVVARESDKGHAGHTLDWVSGETVAVFYDTEEPKLNIAKRVVRVKPAVTNLAPDKAWPSTV